MLMKKTTNLNRDEQRFVLVSDAKIEHISM